MTRVIHTGDTHLGYQQYHSPERREDFLAAFRRVARDAVEDDVDAVVHAGDLFHDRRPALEDLLGTLSVLRELADAGIRFLAVVGNHEGKRDAQWLDLFESLDLATHLGREPVVVGDTAFYGLDYVPRARRDDLDYEFADHDAAHAALVAHGRFQPFDYGEWDAREVLGKATVDFDAMLLGDNHAPGKRTVDGTWVTYCGSTERASAEERDDRGYNVVEFGGGDVAIRRRGLPTREFRFIDVELDEGEGIERVTERVGQYGVEDAVAIVTIEGDGKPVAPAAVEEVLREAGALVARVNDRRERADESGVPEVSFADPDEAVRERVSELGLSPAARDLDGTIRASDVADTNVADAVEERVRELVAEGDPADFRPAPDTDVESETAAERLTDGDGDDRSVADDTDEDHPPSGPETGNDAHDTDRAGADGSGSPAGAAADAAETRGTEEDGAEGDDGSRRDGAGTDAAPTSAEESAGAGAEDQSSLGDYA